MQQRYEPARPAGTWRCTTCGRERQLGDAVPPLTPGLSPKYRQGRCLSRRCRKAERWFELVGVEVTVREAEWNERGVMTRGERVLRVLQSHRGQWVDGPDLANAAVGGSEGLKRLRELRAAGWMIEKRKHPDPRRTIWQYRLVER